MEAFGVRFAVSDQQKFEMLHGLFEEIKKDKDSGAFREVAAWAVLVPDDVKSRFSWLTNEEREWWRAKRNSAVVAVPEPADELGGVWIFDRVFEAIEESEYSLLACVTVAGGIAEMQIIPDAYPYGGVGPFIALAEAFGFQVLGVNEYGKYQSREELLRELGD
jgi:hypothetical protein